MDVLFEKLKQEVETDLGRPLELPEGIELKALFYFGKGVKLKNIMESEPRHIGEILPAVMADILGRMKRQHKSRHRRRVVSAVRDFLSGRKRPKEQVASKEPDYAASQGILDNRIE